MNSTEQLEPELEPEPADAVPAEASSVSEVDAAEFGGAEFGEAELGDRSDEPPDRDRETSSTTDESEQAESAEPVDLRGPIEAVLLVVDEPLSAVTLAQVLDHPQQVVEETLRTLTADYDDARRGFELREVAGGWRFYTREEYAPVVERFVLDGQQAKLTQAALETLAVVAYKQPVSRSRVSAIRGVNCDGVMKTLVARGLVEESGTEEESGATLFRTSSYFLERLGLGSLDELPDLAPYLPEMSELEGIEGVGGPVSVDALAEPSAVPAEAPSVVPAEAPPAEAPPADPGEPSAVANEVPGAVATGEPDVDAETAPVGESMDHDGPDDAGGQSFAR